MRRRYENDIKLYEYVINSNCIGGTIFVDGKNVGVVSSSSLIYVTPKPTISSISIQSNIQDDSYIVFKADVNLYLIDPSDRYNPVYNNTITKQLQYEFK